MAPRDYKLGFFRRVFNAAFTPLIHLGLAPKRNYLLTTKGRKTGLPRTNPVQLIVDPDRKWLVAPYGEVSWVKNARSAGYVTLSRGGKSQDFSVNELAPAGAAPILKRYLPKAPIVQPFFDARPSSDLEEFAKEAHRHPVFALTPRP